MIPPKDTGLGVRKRVIKLLKSFYTVTDDMARRIDICTKLVLRMLDEDETVKVVTDRFVEAQLLTFLHRTLPSKHLKNCGFHRLSRICRP